MFRRNSGCDSHLRASTFFAMHLSAVACLAELPCQSLVAVK